MAAATIANQRLSPNELADFDRAVLAGERAGNAALARAREKIRCAKSCAYFIEHYVKIKDGKRWSLFKLWPDQLKGLNSLLAVRLLIWLKARQVGMTTLVIAWAVWSALFTAGFVTLLFSKGHQEAKEMVRRIRLVIKMLPDWMQPTFETDTKTELRLDNGSHFLSFGSQSSGGDSYTADAVVIDEADLIRNLDVVISGAKPTVDAGGKMILLSRTEKSTPGSNKSAFKNICRAALEKVGEYLLVFFPWFARPGRDQSWYDKIAKEIEDRTFSKDELYANYPATPEQALSARELDKRFPLKWLEDVFEERQPLPLPKEFQGWKHVEFYALPEPDGSYSVGMDVAGGNPNSDDSVATVVDNKTLEECAVVCGKIEPTVHAQRGHDLAKFYNNAAILPEKNHSHGAKCLEALKALKAKILYGHDKRPGWFTDIVRKNWMYDTVAEAVRTKQAIIHSKATFDQLASLDVYELAAPFGQKDDRAVGYALAVQAARRPRMKFEIAVVTTEETKE